MDCGLAIAGTIPGGGIVRAGLGVAKARSVIKAGEAALQSANDGIKLALAGYDQALLASKYPTSLAAKSHTIRNYEAMIDQASNTLAQAETRLRRFTHSMHFWDKVEAPILAMKASFYGCKYIYGVCEDSIHGSFKPRPRPRPTWHPPAAPSAPATPSSPASTYRPNLDPWGEGAFE